MNLPDLPKVVKGALADYRVTGEVEEQNAGEHDFSHTRGPEIRVGSHFNKAFQWHTFFHELIHKWEIEGGFKFKDEDDDSDVTRLGTAMMADFLRNKWTLPGA